MNKEAQFVVKISCLQELGSGFLYCPKIDEEYAYIFTAKHCIFGEYFDNNTSKTDISICFSSNNDDYEAIYRLTENDFLIFDEDDKNDIALLVIPQICLPDWIDSSLSPQLFQMTGDETSCFVNGFPKSVNNEYKRTLGNCKFVADKDFASQFQIELFDKVFNQYNADALVEGYSGSGIFVKIANTTFVCGVVAEYEENHQRFKCINFNIFDELLAKNKLPKLSLREIETNKQVLEDIENIEKNTQRVLERIKAKIGNIHLERKIIHTELQTLIASKTLTVISGAAGIGKSALTKKALELLSNRYEIIALQGEQLEQPSIAKIFQADEFNLKTDFEKIIHSNYYPNPIILFIDSIEKVLETSNAATIIDFLSLIKRNNNIKLVITCRSYVIQQFQIRFLQEFSEFSSKDIPPLSDEELNEIGDAYPQIQSLLDKTTLRKLLKIPFNLNKATFVQKAAFNEGINSEIAFKQLMWEYVIENKEQEVNSQTRLHRATLFSEIALQRAKQMTAYTKISNANVEIIERLVKDDIIEYKFGDKSRYAPTHDIFEDWALTRFISDKYNDWREESSDISDFFDAIGTQPAIRRAFRIWIHEKLQNPDYATKQFIHNTIVTTSLPNFWQDETVIAIMQSAYSLRFLTDNQSVLFQNDFALFNRCTLLLRVACQSPDFTLLHQLTNNKTQLYQNAYLKPIGEGWANMINFIYANLEILTKQYDTIVPLLLQWEKVIDNDLPLPKEARNVGLITLDYLKRVYNEYTDGLAGRNSDDVDNAIILILKLTEVLSEEIKNLLQIALKNENKSGRGWNKTLIEKTLSWQYSRKICQFLPELVLEAAETMWFHYKPTPAEFKRQNKGSITAMLGYHAKDGEEFGVVSKHSKFDYFPASAYQTPIYHLLRYETDKTLAFIVKLFNHSLNTLFQTNFLMENRFEFDRIDERRKVSIILEDGTTVEQYGNNTLWCMYRGTYHATPYLLQSVLMALEDCLLSIAAVVKATQNTRLQADLFKYIDFLLKQSHSVAITSVVASVVTAYYHIMPEKAIVLLKVKEFYGWDSTRKAYEMQSNSANYMLRDPRKEILHDEREASNKLPHRQRHLEDVTRNLSITFFSEIIFSILDNFYAQNPTEQYWRFALNRMDMRKYELGERKDDMIVVQQKIDEDLKPIVAENESIIAIERPLEQVAVWAIQRFKELPSDANTFEKWMQNYEIAAQSTVQISFLKSEGTIASIAIRDYWEELTEPQKEWCIEKALAIVIAEIESSKKEVDFNLKLPYSPFDVEPAFRALMELTTKNHHQTANAKELLFVSLMYSRDEHRICFIVNTFRQFIWERAPDFGKLLLAGLFEYSYLDSMYQRIRYSYQRSKDEQQEIEKEIKEFNDKTQQIVNKLRDKQLNLSIQPIELGKHSTNHLRQCIGLIPFDTQDADLQNLIHYFLRMILQNLYRTDEYFDDKLPHQIVTQFHDYFAAYLLYQKRQSTLRFFDEMIDWTSTINENNYYSVSTKIKFIRECLSHITLLIYQDDRFIPNFWILWNRLFEITKKSNILFFHTDILLSNPYSLYEPMSNPLKDKKQFFEQVIQLTNSTKPTIELLSGIGFTELMPEGVNWYSYILKTVELDKNITSYTEKFVQRVFYTQNIRHEVKNDKILRENFIFILDRLIDKSSAGAFLIREDFITMK